MTDPFALAREVKAAEEGPSYARSLRYGRFADLALSAAPVMAEALLRLDDEALVEEAMRAVAANHGTTPESVLPGDRKVLREDCAAVLAAVRAHLAGDDA